MTAYLVWRIVRLVPSLSRRSAGYHAESDITLNARSRKKEKEWAVYFESISSATILLSHYIVLIVLDLGHAMLNTCFDQCSNSFTPKRGQLLET